MSPILVASEVPASSADSPLITRIALLIEDESLTEAQHRVLARTLSHALGGPLSSERVLALIPLLAKAERFRDIVRAVQAGRMSRTAFLSFLAESRFPQAIKDWLTRAELSRVEDLASAVSAGAIERVESLLLKGS